MATIQGVYLALFGRPADPLGLSFFNAATNNGANLAGIGPLQSSAEYQTRFAGQTNSQIITSIYQALFNREPELAGLTFFTNALTNGTLSINNIAIAIYDGAQGADKTIRDLKEAAANAFTAALDTVAEINGYAGDAAAAAGRAFITGVTTTAPTAEAVAAAVATAVAGGGTGTGKTFTLTGSVDNLVGTTGADTFLGDDQGDQPAISAADVLNGGGGIDVAKLTLTKAATTSLNAVSVEEFQIQALAAATFNAINVKDLTEISTANSTEALVVTNVGTNATVGVIGGRTTAAGTPLDNFTVNFAGGVSGASKVGSIELSSKAAVDQLRIGDAAGTADFGTLNIFTTGGNAVIGDIRDGNGNNTETTTINFTGDSRVTINSALENVTTFDANKSTGGVRVVIDDTKDVKFIGSTGSDRVDVGNAGITSADNLDGGAGSDTLRTSQQISATNGANIKGFEVLDVRGGITQDVDALVANNPFTGVVFSNNSANTVNNINAGAVNNIRFEADEVAATTLTAKGFVSGGTSDTATLILDNKAALAANGVDVASVSFANVDILNINSISDGTPAAGEQNSIGTLTATDIEKIVITGDQEFSLTTSTGTNPTEVDASALTRAVTVNVSADVVGTGVLLRGTAKGDTLTGSGDGNTTGDTFIAGAGSDNMTVDAGGATRVRDTFVYTATALASADVAADTVDTITGFEATNQAGGVANADIINFESGVEAQLKVAGVTLGSANADVTINNGTSFGATTNVAVVNNAGNLEIQFDLDGNGSFNATNDFKIVLTGQSGANVVYDAANDFFYLTNGTTTGTGGADNITGSALADNIVALAGNDTIDGAAGNDTIDGGADADIIIGNTGGDRVTTGAGADIVRVDISHLAGDNLLANADVVTDFTVGTDFFDITDTGGNNALRAGGAAAADVAVAAGGDDIAAGNFISEVIGTTALNAAGLNNVVVYEATGSIVADFTTQAGIANAISTITGAYTANAVANTEMLIVVYDNQVTSNAAIFRYNEGAANGGIDATELSLVAVLQGVGLGTLTNADFI